MVLKTEKEKLIFTWLCVSVHTQTQTVDIGSYKHFLNSVEQTIEGKIYVSRDKSRHVTVILHLACYARSSICPLVRYFHSWSIHSFPKAVGSNYPYFRHPNATRNSARRALPNIHWTWPVEERTWMAIPNPQGNHRWLPRSK